MDIRLTSPTSLLKTWLQMTEAEIEAMEETPVPDADARMAHAVRVRSLIAGEIAERERVAA